MIKVLSGTASELIAQNSLRKSIYITNTDSSINVFLKWEKPGKTTVSSTDFDVRLLAGAVFALTNQQDGLQQIQDRITAISASGTPSVAVFETEDIRR